MEYKEFKLFMLTAEEIGGEYLEGYRKGLRRHFHGENFGNAAEHAAYLARTGEISEGYKDGLNGLPPRGAHGNLGKQNALKGDKPLDARVSFRMTSEQKKTYEALADEQNLKLSSWAANALEEAAKKQAK